MQRKKLPIGIQTFCDIRNPEEGYIYIDKTEDAYNLIKNAKYYFLSRPRRFGKSLFLDTLSEIFKGSKVLFEGLYIYDKWDWQQKHPVIRIDFTAGNYSSEEFINGKINEIVSRNSAQLDVDFSKIESKDVGIMLERLVLEVYQKHKQKVAILIDEYDKPIVDNIGKEDKTTALIARDMLWNFYSAIKVSDKYLRFVFMTGVSKFSRLNLFSGLNNIEDITIDKRYSTITGYTQRDLEQSFKEYLVGVNIEDVKKWYNGYNYFGEPIYNPFDILLFFSKGNEFRNYWWQSGNPNFLIEKLKEGDYFLPELENIEVSEETLNAFDVENIDLVALLWQTGYLTFAGKTNITGITTYKLCVPNFEIQNSLNTLFFNYFTNIKYSNTSNKINTARALLNKDIESFKQELVSLFSSIPYENYVNNTIANYEGYYASVLFAFLSSIGLVVKTEESTNRGRIDMSMLGHDAVFILEFKVDMPAEAALNQIETKKYYKKYQNQAKDIFLIGIHFNSKEKNIEGFERKKFENKPA